MLKFVLPTMENKDDVIAFYDEFQEPCIGWRNYKYYPAWVHEMENRHTGTSLPEGYIRENFYLCYCDDVLVGVFSLKFELIDYLYQYGGHIGYAVRQTCRNKGLATEILKQGMKIAKEFGFEKLLLICDDTNIASKKVIEKNGGIFENSLFDEEENVNVLRFWIDL